MSGQVVARQLPSLWKKQSEVPTGKQKVRPLIAKAPRLGFSTPNSRNRMRARRVDAASARMSTSLFTRQFLPSLCQKVLLSPTKRYAAVAIRNHGGLRQRSEDAPGSQWDHPDTINASADTISQSVRRFNSKTSAIADLQRTNNFPYINP